MTWLTVRKKGLTEIREYVEGEDLTGISVSPNDTPKKGDFIARSPDNHTDQWLVSEEFAKKNYEPV